MRVITGTAKGHKLKAVKGMDTRPTSDKLKGSIFNIIADRIEGSYVLDVFAGTGALGIEALSRGAAGAVFMDKSAGCCSVIKENLAHTKLSDKAEVYVTDYAAGIEKLYKNGRKFDLIILDPPYNKNFIQEALKIMINNDIMDENSVIVAEHSTSDKLPERIGRLEAIDTRSYGDTSLTLFMTKEGNLDK